VSPVTEVIDLRTPTTAPLPVVREPGWDELVPRQRRRRPRVSRPHDRTLWLVEKCALASGYGALLAFLLRYVLTLPVV
jgi:hypothetical protein